MQAYLLSILIFLPILASVAILFIPNKQNFLFKNIAISITFIQLIVAMVIYLSFDTNLSGQTVYENFQFIEKQAWIYLDLGNLGKLSIEYFVGIDGLSVSLVLLATIIMLIGAIASWNVKQKQKAYFALYLLLSGTIVGCFVALDFFLFYLFFEFMLLPMYFLIGIWGGERREYASIKFFLYTLAGSLFILVVMIALFLSVIDPQKTALTLGLIENLQDFNPEILTKVQSLLSNNKITNSEQVHTFNMLYAMDSQNYSVGAWLNPNSFSEVFGVSARGFIFIFVLIGFAIKLPAVPLHTWLPDAHVEAPTAISVVLAGILLKIGGYGILRIAYGIFPETATHYSLLVASLGVLAIIYGAMNALAMSDLKKMVAYSSVSHMGFVLVGIASLRPEGWNGAVFQMFSHGILSALLFLLVAVLYDRTHNREIDNYSGLLHKMPYYSTFVIIAFFASLGLPGFSGFIGELFTILGSFGSEKLPLWIGILTTFGIVLGAGYFLWTLQKMFFGVFAVRREKWESKLIDLNLREWLMLTLLSLITLFLGIFPNLLFNSIDNSVEFWLRFLR